MASDPPAVVAINATRSQQVRGISLYAGWSFVPITTGPLTAQPGSRTQPVERILRPLADSGVLQRVWWLDSRTQEWSFYDPNPALAQFNTLTTVVLPVGVGRQTESRAAPCIAAGTTSTHGRPNLLPDTERRPALQGVGKVERLELKVYCEARKSAAFPGPFQGRTPGLTPAPGESSPLLSPF